MSKPVEHHGYTLKGLMRYLKSTISQKIRYRLSIVQNLVLYSDADWASNKLDRKSISGSVGILYRGPVL